MEIILGKEGNQPFEIKNGCVSRKHAKLTITDDGKWFLEDLNSSNGTYVQNQDGEFIQIKKLEITEFTRIALGSTTATGYFFYAHHVLEPNDSYATEMRHVLDLCVTLAEEKETLEKKDKRQVNMISNLPTIISLLITITISVFFREYMAYVLPIGSAITLLTKGATMYIQKNTSAIKQLRDKQLRMIRCPKCNRPLSPTEIANEQCAACRVHS